MKVPMSGSTAERIIAMGNVGIGQAAQEVAPKDQQTTEALNLMRRPKGATLDEITAATGWSTSAAWEFLLGVNDDGSGVRFTAVK